MTEFKELGVREELLTAITELGYENPMPIQEDVIPFILSETNDLIALAQTGTGKTAAFGLPLLTLTDTALRQIHTLILSPTRELCIQISNDLKSYSPHLKGMKVVPVYGGESIVNQFRQLDVPPQILVATPGRLIDLLNRKKVNLSHVQYVVLDEADEMLNMGFQEDIETILQSVPDNHRTFLFSATMPKEVERIAKKYMKATSEIAVGVRNAGSDNVEHVFYVVQAANRYLALKRIVDMNPDIYGIVFCRTRQETKDVADKLMRDGYNADALHGDLSQAQRDSVMNKFRIRNLQILVATDVAARGLDVSDLTHVINYNLPDEVEIYTHRSGRTGRVNKKGVSVSIVHTRERNRIRNIEKSIGKTFRQEQVPSGMDICKRQLFALIDRMENVQVNSEEIEQFLPHVFKKLSYLEKDDVIRHFVSLEFNRFLDYYKDAPDLNIVEKEKDKARKEGFDNGNFKRGEKVRLKINYGLEHNATPSKVLTLINKFTRDKSISINKIEVTQKFTFFDVYADQVDCVLYSFEMSDNYEASIAKGSKQYDDNPPRRFRKDRKRRSDEQTFSGGRDKKRNGFDKKERKESIANRDKREPSDGGKRKKKRW